MGMSPETIRIDNTYAAPKFEVKYGPIHVSSFYYINDLLRQETVEQLAERLKRNQQLLDLIKQKDTIVCELELTQSQTGVAGNAAHQRELQQELKDTLETIKMLEREQREHGPKLSKRVFREIATTLYLNRELPKSVLDLIRDIFMRLSFGEDARSVLGLKGNTKKLSEDENWANCCIIAQLIKDCDIGEEVARYILVTMETEDQFSDANKLRSDYDEKQVNIKKRYRNIPKNMREVIDEKMKITPNLVTGAGYEELKRRACLLKQARK